MLFALLASSLQVITFIDVFLRYTAAKSVLVVVPINTIQNWLSEFNRWCPVTDPDLGYTRPYQLYILNESSKKLEQRAKIVRSWSLTGGTLIIGYEMFRLMVTKKSSATSTSTRITTTVNITSASDPTASLLPEVDDEEKSVESMDGKSGGENVHEPTVGFHLRSRSSEHIDQS